MSRRKHTRSDGEEKEYLHGKIRLLEKRIKMLERDNHRLLKILMQNSIVPEDMKPKKIKIKKDIDFLCEKCKNEECEVVELWAADGKRKFIICKSCGHRKRVDKNVGSVDANR